MLFGLLRESYPRQVDTLSALAKVLFMFVVRPMLREFHNILLLPDRSLLSRSSIKDGGTENKLGVLVR